MTGRWFTISLFLKGGGYGAVMEIKVFERGDEWSGSLLMSGTPGLTFPPAPAPAPPVSSAPVGKFQRGGDSSAKL